jgi:hypothetical protein
VTPQPKAERIRRARSNGSANKPKDRNERGEGKAGFNQKILTLKTSMMWLDTVLVWLTSGIDITA